MTAAEDRNENPRVYDAGYSAGWKAALAAAEESPDLQTGANND